MSYKIEYFRTAANVCIAQKINGDYNLTFKLNADDPNAALIVTENVIEADGQLFVIKNIEATHATTAILKVSAEHIFNQLLNEHIPEMLIEDITPTQALTETFNIPGIEFTLGTIEPTTNLNFLDLMDTNPVEVLAKIIEQTGGELLKDNYTVSLLNRLGSENGVQFRYAKNIKTITRTVNTKGLVTRLYAYGKDDLDITEVNPTGMEYIDSQYIGNYSRPRCGVVTFSNVEDDTELLIKAQQYLAENEIPVVSYSVAVVELHSITGSSEQFGIGDTVEAIDSDLGIRVKTRIVAYNKYIYEPWKSTVELSTVLPDASSILASLAQTQATVERITTASGRISTVWLEGIINTLRNRVVASGSYAQAQVLQDAGILLENFNQASDDYGALYLGPGIFAISNQQDETGAWDWRTFGTGKGFTADEITGGLLQGIELRLGDPLNPDLYFNGTSLTVKGSIDCTTLRINGANALTEDALLIADSAVNIQKETIDKLNVVAGSVKADWVYAGNIAADHINAGTLTGFTIQTEIDEVLNGVRICGDTGTMELYNAGTQVMEFRFDTAGAGTPEESQDRVFMSTLSGYALKIQSIDADISISATNNHTIYLGNVVFCGSVYGVHAQWA